MNASSLQKLYAFVAQVIPRRCNSITSGNKTLTDKFNRFHSYLRISLSEKCNLRCKYCMPAEGVPLTPSDQILKVDEILRLTRVFATLGVEKVRLTGGEPTMRKELEEIITGIALTNGIKQVSMTSNGVALSGKLDRLLAAGLGGLNISIDTLHEPVYELLTRRKGYKQVWKTIDKAETRFERLKLNCVVMRQINDHEVVDFVELTRHRNLDIRFIEFMPFTGNEFAMKKFVPYHESLLKITEHFGRVDRLQDHPNDTSKAYKIPGSIGQFGFISSMSEHFCNTCNRLRITADGNLKVCLHGSAEVSLRDAMRSGASDDDLQTIIGQAVNNKKKQHAGIEQLMTVTNRPMILIDKLKTSVPFFLYDAKQTKVTVGNRFYSTMTHVDNHGKANMVDVSGKSVTTRVALAQAKIQVTKAIMEAIVNNDTIKGDALAVSRIAGIMAAKKTPDLIPLCHPISLADIQVKFMLNKEKCVIFVFARVKTTSPTGVEMEALTCCSVASLALYDMCKGISHEMSVGSICLVGKRGGKHDIGVVDFEKLPIRQGDLK